MVLHRRLMMVVLCLALVSLGSVMAAEKETEIRIGVFEPMTGAMAAGGQMTMEGIQLAQEQRPNVLGLPVRVILVDNRSDKVEAATAVTRLIQKDKVCAIIGSYGSALSMSGGPVAQAAKVPVMGCSPTNPLVTLGNDYYFRVCFLDPFQGTVMANYAWQEGAKKAAVITQLGDDYSSGLGSFFVKAFTALGGTVVEQQFQTNQTDFKAILTEIKAQNPDIIFAPSSIATAPLLIKQARELGITAPITAGDTWQNQTIADNAGADAEGVVVSTFFDEADTTNTVATDFVKGFKEYLKAHPDDLEKNGGEGVAAVSALGYDGYMVAIAAIEAAGSTDGTAIRDALAGVTITGVTGDISFDENGDAKKDMAYLNVIEGGKFTFLKTVSIG